MPEESPTTEVDPRTGALPRVKWDDSAMRSSYANVCNVSSTHEEFTLLFGTNESWQGGQGDVVVRLSNRIVLNPHAAKRLASSIGGVVEEYERRFGELRIEETPPAVRSVDGH